MARRPVVRKKDMPDKGKRSRARINKTYGFDPELVEGMEWASTQGVRWTAKFSAFAEHVLHGMGWKRKGRE